MCARPDGSSCPSLEEWSFIQQIGDLSTLKESKKQNEWQVLVQPVMSDVCPHLRLYERLSNPQTCLLNWWIATRFKQTKPMDSDAVTLFLKYVTRSRSPWLLDNINASVE